MNNRSKLKFDTDFYEIVIDAQKEARRLGVDSISDILIMKTLIFNSESYMSDFLSQGTFAWSLIRETIDKIVKEWVSEATKAPGPEIKTIEAEVKDGVIKINFAYDETIGTIFKYSQAYLHEISEISFVISMLNYKSSSYIVDFFKSIGVDTISVARYYEGLVYERIWCEYVKRHAKKEQEEPDEQDEMEDSDELDPFEEFERFESFEEMTDEADDESNEYKDEAEAKTESNETEETEKTKKETIQLPKKLQTFVKILKADKSEKSPILGREKETEALTKVLLKAKKSNAILVGKAGVGKTAIVEHLAWLIENDKCVDALKGKTVLSLAVNDIVAGTMYRGMAEERIKLIAEYLSNVKNVILFIDEIHNVIGAGSTGTDDKLDMANALKPILAREGISVIGATTEEEYERIFARDEAFKRRFEKIVVREPKPEDVYHMIKEQVNRLMKYHNVKIPKNVVEFIVNVSSCFVFETNNPDRTIDIIDRSMAAAALKGKKTVTKEIVMSNFDANFELYKKMSPEHKLSTAYHEVGHYLVAKARKSFAKKALAISIIPAENYLGVTVWEDEPALIEWSYDDHLHNIAISLAGRVAEKMYSGKDTSGASDDLRKASEEARKMVLEYGLSNKFSRRNSSKDLSEDRTQMLNTEIDRIISEGYQLAEKILKEQSKQLKTIAESLTEKGMLMGQELEKICKKTECRISKKT